MASIVDMNTLGSLMQSTLESHADSKKNPAAAAQQQAALPKPKFEFYTLLTNDAAKRGNVRPTEQDSALHAMSSTQQSPVSSAAVKSASKQVLTLPKQEAYLLQVASFKQRQDADRMKAALVMKGFDVNVKKSVQENGRFYRVILGPFATKEEAQKMQTSFALQEHIVGMIRRMDA